MRCLRSICQFGLSDEVARVAMALVGVVVRPDLTLFSCFEALP